MDVAIRTGSTGRGRNGSGGTARRWLGRGLAVLAVLGLGAPAARATLQDLAGTYTGTWNNTTFASSGGASLTLSVVGADFEATVDMDGFALGLPDPAPVQITGSVVGGNAQIDQSGLSPYGHVVGTIDGTTGAVDFTLSMTDRVDILSVGVTGTIAGGSMDLAYTVNFMGMSPAAGTLTALLPEPGSGAAGAASLAALAALARRRRRGV